MAKLYKQKSARSSKMHKSFTLAELIFEIAVITLLIIPIVMLLGQLSMNVVDTEVNSTASLLSIQKSEELLANYDFDTISADSGSFAAPYNDYSYQITVQCVNSENLDLAADCGQGYKKATLTVSHGAIPDIVVNLLFVDI